MLKMKYLWTLALIALCVALASGLAFVVGPSWTIPLEDDTHMMDLPDAMAGGDTYDATVTAENNGDTVWDHTYSLNEVMGITVAPDPVAIERWSVGQVLLGTATTTVGYTDDPDTEDVVENQFEFEFTITAPPWVTLVYDTPLLPTGATIPESSTSVPEASSFEDNYIMEDGGGNFMRQDIAATDTTVQHPEFSDVDTDNWAWAQIQECANAASVFSPFVVQGYGDGSYQPTWDVTRASMAVYIARAVGLITGAEEATFPDVPTSYWAFAEIEACVFVDIVKGYTDGLYRPGSSVTRDQMAVYIQRAVNVPTATHTYVDKFVDIVDEDSPGWWARDSIQTCVDLGIVQGYADEMYRPPRVVSRDQMAVFVWRALVMPTGDVVIGGPAPTEFAEVATAGADQAALFLPGALSYYGWDVPLNDDDEPLIEPGSTVFVALDAVRVGDGDITFTVSHVVTDPDTEEETTVEDGTDTVTVDQALAKAAVEANDGNPYLVASYQIPAIAAGTEDVDYTVTVTLPRGGELEVGTFTVAAP